MADISAFPAIQDVLVSGKNVREFTATEAITAGMVVGYAATGVSNAVVPMDGTSGETAIGVAIKSAAITKKVKVAMLGCVVKMVNADDTTAIDAGDYVEQNDNALQGTVSPADVADISGAVGTSHWGVIGIAEEDIAGSAYGRVRIQPMYLLQVNDA
jgi:hypothetical protein